MNETADVERVMISKLFSDSFITINLAVSVYLSILYVAIMSFFFLCCFCCFLFFAILVCQVLQVLPYLIIMVPYFLSHVTSPPGCAINTIYFKKTF